MAAPSPPFATSAMVATLLSVKLNKATDFSSSTIPTDTQVDQFLTWVSGQVEMQFSMAGYKVPLATISGETWPTSQTYYLQLVTTLGAAAMAGGHSQKPAPALAPGSGQRGGSGNILQDLFQGELDKIYRPGRLQNQGVTAIRFRAQYYAGSPAERVVVQPKGPTTDFMEGKFDPMRHLSLWDISDRMLQIQQTMEDLDVNWDYLYNLFSLQKGLGTSNYEGIVAGV